MEALISFDFSKMTESIKIGNINIDSNIGTTFLDLLSLNLDSLENEILKKIDFNDINEIKKVYKKMSKKYPLLFIDKYNLIQTLNNLKSSKKEIHEYDNSIKLLSDIINNQKKFDINSPILNELNKNLNYLKQRKKNYNKITNNFSKYINTVFSIIFTKIKLYKSLVDFCYINKTDMYFEGFSNFSPLNKFIFFSKYECPNKNLLNNIPSSNISFNFSFNSKESREDFLNTIKKAPDIALKQLFENNVTTKYEYNCKALEQFLQLSFFTCLTQNLNIKKCENCGKYFIAYQRSDEKYCNRNSIQDSTKTCKQYANSENWKNNINSNEELKLYRRIYMAKQMKTRRNPENLKLKKEFEEWKKEAKIQKRQYLQGDISKETYISWLTNDINNQ